MFTLLQCHFIEAKAFRAFLLHSGYPGNFPRAMVNGPQKYGGKGYRPISTEQGLEKILKVVSHVRQQSELGCQIRILVETTQLLAGTSAPLWMSTQQPLPHCAPSAPWVFCIRTFLHKINGSIHLSSYYVPPAQRARDVAIMDIILEHCKSPATLERFTQVRVYLQVFWLSDILNGSGLAIRRAFYDNPPSDLATPRTTLRWPRQGRPGPAAFQTWRSLLKKAFLETGSKSLMVLHRYRQGSWIIPPSTLHRPWQYFYDPQTQRLYHRTLPDRWHTYTPIRSSSTSVSFDPLKRHPASAPPPTAIPASVDERLIDRFRATFQSLGQFEQPQSQKAPTFRDYLHDGSVCDHLLRYFKFRSPDSHSQLETILRHGGELWLVSDGGAIPHTDLGSYGFVVATADTVLAEGGGQTPASYDEMTSFRAELCGGWIMSWMLRQFQLHTIVTLHHALHIYMYCDNDAALARLERSKTSFTRFRPNQCLRTDYDIEAGAHESLQHFPIEYRKVHGHADREKDWDDLDWPEKLNYYADQIATAQLLKAKSKFYVPFHSSTRAELQLQGIPVAGKYRQHIRHQASFDTLRKHLLHLHPLWTNAIWDTIDWPAHGAVLGQIRQNQARTTRMNKFLARRLPVGRITRHYKEGGDGRCPSCKGVQAETEDHLFRCTNPERRAFRAECLADFQIKLITQKTCPDLQKFLMTSIHRWILAGDITTTNPKRHLRLAASQQRSIGWAELFRGRVSREFGKQQELYYRRNNFPKNTATGNIWTKKLILSLWDLFESLWEDRNQALHPSYAAQQLLLLEDLRSRVHTAYLAGAALSQSDRQLFFSNPEEDVVAGNIDQLRTWLNIVDPVLTAARHENHSDTPNPGTLAQRHLFHYFPTRADIPPRAVRHHLSTESGSSGI